MIKTNVMRILDQKKIKYEAHYYDVDENLDAISVAKKLNEDPLYVFKTLVLTDKKDFYVVVINALDEIDLKKAAKAFNIKSLEMLPLKDLTKVTGGYVRGGTSPIGMKKLFKTIIDINAKNIDKIIVSGGKRGTQVELEPSSLAQIVNAKFDDVKR